MQKQIMDFNVLIEQDEDGIYVARVPELDRCYTQGKTLQELLERIREAIEVCLEEVDQKVKLEKELEGWDRLGDEALINFEKNSEQTCTH